MIEATASYSYPVLGDNRMDYREGCVYKTCDWRVDTDEVYLRHHIDGDSLVSRLIKSGEACFSVAVIIKATMYRNTFVVACDGELSIAQTIPIEKGRRTVELPKFLPMVIYKGDDKTITVDETMGLDELWNGCKFDLFKGAIIAKDQGYEFMPGLSHLMRVKEADLDEGAIEVEIATTSGGYFTVRAHPDLCKAIRQAHSSEDKRRHRDSILTHALSVGFAKFSDRHSDDEGLADLENFQTVRRILMEKDINVWDEDGFDPCEAACAFLPHYLDSGIKPAEENRDE